MLQLPRSTVQKLTHESAEIRLRSLEHIHSKIERALAHDQQIDFTPHFLCKQLIRWFAFIPVKIPSKPLVLLSIILRSKYGEETIHKIGVDRLIREFKKIEIILKNHQNELCILLDIQHFLEEYKRHQANNGKICELMSTLQLNENMNISGAAQDYLRFDGCTQEDYEIPWTKPTVADYNTLKFLSDVLISPTATTAELRNTLQHLQITMYDYPAEYMLQRPDIYLNLVFLFDRAEELHCPYNEIIRTFLVYLKILSNRLNIRCKSIAYAVLCQNENDGAGDIEPRSQLRVEKALQLLLEKCLYVLQSQPFELLPETVPLYELLKRIFGIYNKQGFHVNTTSLTKLMCISDELKNVWLESTQFAAERIKYLLIAFIIQDVTESNGKQVCFDNVSILEPLLRDYAFSIIFPHRHKRLESMLFLADEAIKSKYETLKEYEESIGISISLLKSATCLENIAIIEHGDKILLTVTKLRSFKLIELLVHAIVECDRIYPHNEGLRQKVNVLIMELLRIPNESLKEFVYVKLCQIFKKNFACLMNGESFCTGIQNAQLLKAQIMGIPLSSDILLQLVHEGYEASNKKIKKVCEDMLSLLVKSKHLLGGQWMNFLNILLPILPLLQCWTFSTKMTELLLHLFDPDANNVPSLDMLKGNICFLFHPSEEVRNEALTRLIYIVNSMEGSDKFLPNIIEVSDLLPNDICILRTSREYSRIFLTSETDREIYDTMVNLFNILDCPDVEPLIRKTTLMQLNSICQNWEATAILSNEAASYLILQALENSLRKASFSDYTDAAIPSVGILSKLLFYNSELRQELASVPNIFILLLRTLFLYQNDLQIQQDASLCLFQLIFSNFMVIMGHLKVEVPLVLSNMKLPLNFELNRSNSSNLNTIDAKLHDIFMKEQEVNLYLSQLIAVKVCGGATKISSKVIESLKDFDIAEELKLSSQAWQLFKSTIPEQNLKRFAIIFRNTTKPNDIIMASQLLSLQLLLSDENMNLEIPNEIASALFNVINHSIQMVPDSEDGFNFYESLIDFCEVCAHAQWRDLIMSLSKALQNDFQHALLTLLRHPTTPLRLYYKITTLFLQLLHSPISFKTSKTDPSVFYSNCFEYVINLIEEYLKKRDLQRARCLLTVLHYVSKKNLQMSDKLLFNQCKRIWQFSLTLKSSTQTGAHWHRKCLQLLCQLRIQMQNPEITFKFPGNIVRYISGLCGHHDGTVRTLAWKILMTIASDHDRDENNTRLLLTELNYLPGGLLSCCLCTLLDQNELIMVRQIAGNLLVLLLAHQISFEEILSLLQQQRFFEAVCDASVVCHLEEHLPLNFDYTTCTEIVSCELISCYSRICSKLLMLRDSFIQELCEKPFMFKFHEIMKISPSNPHPAYFRMCADICQLYSLCFKGNFLFLQRTICRDNVWLKSFYQLLSYSMLQEDEIAMIVQLLLILCNDDVACDILCENFDKCSDLLSNLFKATLEVSRINTSLQKISLSVLSLLMIKSQKEREDGEQHPKFITTFERAYYVLLDEEKEQKREGEKVANKENNKDTIKTPNFTKDKNTESLKSNDDYMQIRESSLAGSVFIGLYKIFLHLFPSSASKFDYVPNSAQIQISETIAIVLKFSILAQNIANDLKFLDKILTIFESFFRDFKLPCHTFVRRYGENKKVAIVKNMQLLLHVLQYWYSSATAIISQDNQACRLTKILTQVWPWLNHSVELKHLVLQVCVFCTEHSLIVCQHFASVMQNSSNSLLQLVIKVVTSETNKVKAASSDSLPIIQTGLRIIINCSSCTDGRITLIKAHILDVFDSMQPFNPKSPKVKQDILISWLQFWELFTRYSEGAVPRNLNSLCEVINRTKPRSTVRLLSLKILRNMSFLDANRSTLVTSNDFIYTVNDVIAQSLNEDEVITFEEQMHVSVAIWKIISGGVKYVAIIRGTKLAKKLDMLRGVLHDIEEKNATDIANIPFAESLLRILDIIFDIFYCD